MPLINILCKNNMWIWKNNPNEFIDDKVMVVFKDKIYKIDIKFTNTTYAVPSEFWLTEKAIIMNSEIGVYKMNRLIFNKIFFNSNNKNFDEIRNEIITQILDEDET